MKPTKNPVLYIVMRNDLDSMSPGKAMAHAAHAANAFVHKASRLKETHPAKKLYDLWARSTPQGFGTTVCLAGTIEKFENATQFVENDGGIGVRENLGIVMGVIHDPTYPLKDGEVTHLIPLDTCAYFFCDKEDATSGYMKALPLHTRGWAGPWSQDR